jgi:hypothetical protein
LPRQRLEFCDKRIELDGFQEISGKPVGLARLIGPVAAHGEDWRASRGHPRRAKLLEEPPPILVGHAEIDQHGVKARAGRIVT